MEPRTPTLATVVGGPLDLVAVSPSSARAPTAPGDVRRPATRAMLAVIAAICSVVASLSLAGPSWAATRHHIGAAPQKMTVERLVSSGVKLRVSCTTRCRVSTRLTALGDGRGVKRGTVIASTVQRVRGRRVVVRLRPRGRLAERLLDCRCLGRTRLSTTLTRGGRPLRTRSQTIRLSSRDPDAPRPGTTTPDGTTPPACSSTPRRLVFGDPRGDDVGPGETSLAPDVLGVEVVTDSTCTLSVGLLLADHPYVGMLAHHQVTAIYLDVDGDPGTGDPSGGDVLIKTVGTAGPDDRVLAAWDPALAQYVDSAAPGEAFQYGGIRTTFASLGITRPVDLGVRVLTVFEQPQGIIGFDFAPDKPGTGAFQSSFRAPISFAP